MKNKTLFSNIRWSYFSGALVCAALGSLAHAAAPSGKSASPSVAAAPDPDDEVKAENYSIVQRNQAVGSERIRVTKSGDWQVYTSKTGISAAGLSFTTESAYEKQEIKHYHLKGLFEGKPIKVDVERQAAGYLLSYELDGKSDSKLIESEAPMEIVDNNTSVHFVYFAQRYFGAQKQRFKVIIPQTLQTAEMQISDEGAKVVDIFQTPIEVHMLRCQYIGGPAVDLAVGLDRKLYGMSVPSQAFAFFASREQVEAYAKAHPVKPENARDPDEIALAKAEEQPLTFQNGVLTLYGVLTQPTTQTSVSSGTSAKPIALILPGSGQHSRDVVVGPHRISADVAGILAQQGIASLRFDKRFYTYRNLPAGTPLEVTFENEILSDADSALKFIRDHAAAWNIDPARIILVGHSQGAQAALALSARDKRLKSLILLEPMVETLDAALVRQQQYLLKYRDELDDESIATNLKPLNESLKKLKSGVDEAGAPMTVAYYQSLQRYPILALASQMRSQRILIIQGAADYQVLPQDTKRLLNALKPLKTDVTYVEIPKMNHILREVKRPRSDGREYQDVGGVMNEVKEAIQKFTKH